MSVGAVHDIMRLLLDASILLLCCTAVLCVSWEQQFSFDVALRPKLKPRRVLLIDISTVHTDIMQKSAGNFIRPEEYDRMSLVQPRGVNGTRQRLERKTKTHNIAMPFAIANGQQEKRGHKFTCQVIPQHGQQHVFVSAANFRRVSSIVQECWKEYQIDVSRIKMVGSCHSDAHGRHFMRTESGYTSLADALQEQEDNPGQTFLPRPDIIVCKQGGDVLDTSTATLLAAKYYNGNFMHLNAQISCSYLFDPFANKPLEIPEEDYYIGCSNATVIFLK